MKIKIKQSILIEHLNNVVKGLSNKNLIPVLNCIKIEVEDTGLYLTTTNNDISIKVFIAKKYINAIEKTGTIVVYGRFFHDIIRKLPNEIINIEEVLDNKLNIYTESTSFYLNCNNANDFPSLNFQTKQNNITISQQVLKNIINQTIYATSTNEDRPNITGLNIKIKEDKLTCTGTDSYRVSTKTINIPIPFEEEVDIIIPNKNLLELMKLLNDETETVELHIFNNSILFKFSTILFISRLINGNFPNVFNIIPKELKIKLKVNYNEFYKAIDRASLLSKEETKQTIKLEIKDNELIISSIIPEIGKVEEQIKLKEKATENLIISFSSKYMLDALKTLDSDFIIVYFNSYVTPIVIKTEEEENFIQLFQPIRTH